MSLGKEIDDINKQIKQLWGSLNKVGKAKIFDEKDIEAAKTFVNGLNAEFREMHGNLDYVLQSFTDSVNELSKQNAYLNSAKKSLSSISDISRKVLEYRKGDSQLSEKQLKNLQKQAKARFDELQLLARKGNLTKENREELIAALQEQEKFEASIQQTIDAQKQVNKQMGLFGGLIGGAGKALEKMGFTNISKSISDGIEKTKQARLQTELNNKALEETQSEIDAIKKKNGYILSDAQLRAGFGGKELKDLVAKKDLIDQQNKNLSSQTNKYKNIVGSLKEQFSLVNLIDIGLVQLIAALKSIDSGAGDMAKSMNITYSEALKVREGLTGIANSSHDSAVNTKGLQETLMHINKTIGARVSLNDKDLVTFTKMREQAGLTNEEIYGIQQLSTLNNKTLEQTNNEILGAARAYAGKNKLAINEKEILKDVSKASMALKLSLGGSVEKLAEAAIKTRQFGLNLEQAEKMAGSLLQFESSIESELSAELLTGRDLNLEKARSLALSGDSAGAAAEIAKQMGSAAEFGKMNVIQQEALAKAAGMSREELAKSLADKEALNKLGVKGAKDAQDAYNKLKAQGLSESQIAAKLGSEDQARMYEQQSMQERFNQALEKVKEIFINIGNVLMPIFEIFTGIFDIIGPIVGYLGQAISFLAPFLKFTLGIWAGWKGIQLAQQGFIASKRLLLTLETAIGTKLEEQRALNLQSAAVQTEKNVAKETEVVLENESFLVRTRNFLLNLKDLAIEKGKSLLSKLQLGIETATNALKKKGLMLTIKDAWKSIAGAAMSAYESAAKIPGIGWILGGIAAGAVVGLGASLMSKGDDVLSPGGSGGGYGKRVLFGPEGAISLNDKDTVIAGTNLFPKGDDVMSAPKNTFSVSNSTAPKKDSSPAPNNNDNIIEKMANSLGKQTLVKVQ